MTVERRSEQLSIDLVRIVSKQYYLVSFGIENCGDPHADGEVYDIYLRKKLYEKGIDCDVDIKTINKL